jgi:hypothetical protein
VAVVSHRSGTFPSIELKTRLLGPSALQQPLTVISIVYIKTCNYVNSWEEVTSENQGDSDKAIYGFKIYKISIITIRITYHQIKVDINP